VQSAAQNRKPPSAPSPATVIGSSRIGSVEFGLRIFEMDLAGKFRRLKPTLPIGQGNRISNRISHTFFAPAIMSPTIRAFLSPSSATGDGDPHFGA